MYEFVNYSWRRMPRTDSNNIYDIMFMTNNPECCCLGIRNGRVPETSLKQRLCIRQCLVEGVPFTQGPKA